MTNLAENMVGWVVHPEDNAAAVSALGMKITRFLREF